MPPRTRKNRDPLAARKLDLEAVNLPADAATLATQQDIEVTRAGQKRGDQRAKEDTARRVDAFAALKEGMKEHPFRGCYDAARRLERDILIRLDLCDRGQPPERVDCEPTRDRAYRMVEAGERVRQVLDRLPARDGWLLQELIAPPVNRGTWRDHVAYITGETHTHAQGAAVRAACVNLRDAYTAMERRAAA